MSGCCDATALHFDDEHVARDLRTLERDGPGPTTAALVELLADAGVEGCSVLDAGGGLGAAAEGLAGAGAARITLLDASESYIRAARERAWARGRDPAVEYRVGDFVTAAHTLPEADVVVLDRVLCCDPRMEDMVEAAAGRAGRLLGASYPRDRLAARLGLGVENLIRRLRGDAFRSWVHPVAAIRDAVKGRGFSLRSTRHTFLWEIAVYERVDG